MPHEQRARTVRGSFPPLARMFHVKHPVADVPRCYGFAGKSVRDRAETASDVRRKCATSQVRQLPFAKKIPEKALGVYNGLIYASLREWKVRSRNGNG